MTAVQVNEARELTPEEQEERAAACYKLEEAIKSNIADGRSALWQLAENLYVFKENNGHTALGYETQEEWLAQPDIGMTRVQYFRLARKWRELVVYRHVPMDKLIELEPSKVDIVMPVIENNKAKLEDVLENVKSLGARDLRDLYMPRGAPSEPPPEADGDDDEVIDGTAIVLDDGPTKASEVGVDGEVDPDLVKLNEEISQSASVVDSWVEMGGDRRKAMRHFRKLEEIHPIFSALALIRTAVEGGEGAPDRTSIGEEWQAIVRALNLKIQS